MTVPPTVQSSSTTETGVQKDPKAAPRPFIAIDPSFLSILQEDCSVRCLTRAEDGRSFAHEAGVWVEALTEVWFTSNLYFTPSAASSSDLTQARVEISAVDPSNGKVRVIDTPDVPVGNGACPYGDFILFCDQGGDEGSSSQLTLVDPSDPKRAEILIDNFCGRDFNSLNDVVVLPPPLDRRQTAACFTDELVDAGRSESILRQTIPRGSTVWFTDPPYGFEQSFRPPCQLPPQVYSLDPHTGHVRVVADGFDHPNGICFSPDGKVCYVTDTSHIHGSGRLNPALQSTIYALDVVWLGPPGAPGGPSLQNRRVFAFADTGVPDGIKCDDHGNVYAGCGDGIHVWNQWGTLIGKIILGLADNNPGAGCANFCFIPGGRLVCFAEDRIYLVEGLTVRGDLIKQ